MPIPSNAQRFNDCAAKCIKKGGNRVAAMALIALSLTALPHAYVAHEWGTFTTLVDSRGHGLSGLFLDDERLPFFVDSLPFYYPPQGSPAPDPIHLAGVTTKMETPILYFYSDSAFHAEVNIGFNGGAITQWYPQRDSGDSNPTNGRIDFLHSNPVYQGNIRWKCDVLAPNTTQTVTHSTAPGDWIYARQPPSNLVKSVGGDIEKFLFYRGLGHLDLPLLITMPQQDSLVIQNTYSQVIPYILVLDLIPSNESDSTTGVWWQGSLRSGETLKLARPKQSLKSVSAALSDFNNALVLAGLSGNEASNMLLKWNYNYFQVPGFKVFWVLPRTLTDAILPLRLTPPPDSLNRVLVGRSEILTPDFESKLRRAGEAGSLASYQSDRFYLAYQDYLMKWAASASFTLPQFPRARTGGRLQQGNLSRVGLRSPSATTVGLPTLPWTMVGQIKSR